MKLKIGLIRAWIAVSSVWLAFSIYEIVSAHHTWKTSHEAGRTLAEILDKERKSMTAELVAKYRQKNADLNSLDIKIPFDEIATENAAYLESQNYLKTTDNYKWREECFTHAFAARDRRDLFAKIALIPPAILGVLVFLSLWVVRGFAIPLSND